MKSNSRGGLLRVWAHKRANGWNGRPPKRVALDRRLTRRYSSGLRAALLWLATSMAFPSFNFALDQLPDLTDKAAQAVVTLKGRDNFNSEYQFDVSVKNLSDDPLVGESLVIVLDRITDISGDQWTSGTSESNLSRMEILGQDGETSDGKPYFRIPLGPGSDLPPYTESAPATVRIRNKDYLIVFTPIFRVHGLKRTPVPTKPKEPVSPLPRAKLPADQKGALSEAEGRTLPQQ